MVKSTKYSFATSTRYLPLMPENIYMKRLRDVTSQEVEAGPINGKKELYAVLRITVNAATVVVVVVVVVISLLLFLL